MTAEKSQAQPAKTKGGKRKAAPKKATAKPRAAQAARKKTYSFKKNIALFEKATTLIPQGIYGHHSPALTVPGSFPYYAAKGAGCRYQDIDGNKFIDYMCAYGPMVLGYAHKEVNAAAIKALELGDCLNHPSPYMIQLAERLTGLMPFADWAVFGKNGSDMTTWATQVAREHTGRRKIVVVKKEYHGAHAWCTPGHGGLIAEDRAHMLSYEWNRADQLESLFKKHEGDIAAVMMTPFHHPTFEAGVLPEPGFWREVQKLCNDNGALLILDDVRAGWRLSLRGSQDYFDFTPDIACYCKAIANGYPIAATVGKDEFKAAAGRVFLTGSFWFGMMCMAAALATIDILEKEKGIKTMFQMGALLDQGLRELGDKYGLPMKLTGPLSLPYLVLEDDPDLWKIQRFCSEVTIRGSFFHPHHNWFLSAAHTKADIQETLGHCEDALKVMAG